jgi:hypothetical protein
MVLRLDAKQSLDRKVLVEKDQELLMSVTLMLVGMVSAWLAVAFAMLWGILRIERRRPLFRQDGVPLQGPWYQRISQILNCPISVDSKSQIR